MKRFIAALFLCAFFAGCYPGGIGKWKGIPDHHPVPEHCKDVRNPCSNPWAYPPLHD